MSKLTRAIRSPNSTTPPRVALAPFPSIRSKRPAKQLFWLWLAEDMKASADFRDGLDVGCGDMSVKPLFRTATYTGLDKDAARLTRAAEKNPDATIVVGSVEELALTGDFVVCVQLLGSKWLDLTAIDRAIENLIGATRPRGTLLFNHKNESAERYRTIERRLALSFATVSMREYAAVSALTDHDTSLRLALSMRDNPVQRGTGRAYFACSGRR